MSQVLQASTFGEQRTLVVLANAPSLLSQAREAFFGAGNSLDSFYRDSSYGLTWFTGDIYLAAFSMPSTCDVLAVKALADAAAVAQGANMDAYTRHIYVVPGIPCPWSGFSTWGPGYTTPNGTTYSGVWLNGLGNWDHEMGHSFGLTHAATFNPYYEYGDPTDVMGGATRQFDGPHKEDLRWVAAQVVTVGGTYSVTPLELAGGTPLLKIPKPDTGEFYYVSYRQPMGPYDGTFYHTLTDGVSIHVWRHVQWNDDTTWPSSSTGYTTKLVDTMPSTGHFLDAPLVDGASFYDSANRITITQMGHTAASAVVSVMFNASSPPPQCSDGIDNDGDGLVDFPADPGCSSTTDDDEFNPPPPPPNTPPTITITSPTPGASSSCPATVLFSASASDAEDGGLSNSVQWSEDGVIFATGASVTKKYGCGHLGSHTVTARVTDRAGASATAEIRFSIQKR